MLKQYYRKATMKWIIYKTGISRIGNIYIFFYFAWRENDLVLILEIYFFKIWKRGSARILNTLTLSLRFSRSNNCESSSPQDTLLYRMIVIE